MTAWLATCAECGADFATTRAHARFCGSTCRSRDARTRARRDARTLLLDQSAAVRARLEALATGDAAALAIADAALADVGRRSVALFGAAR